MTREYRAYVNADGELTTRENATHLQISVWDTVHSDGTESLLDVWQYPVGPLDKEEDV